MPQSLRTQLIGTWKLLSFDFTPADGSPSRPGFGPDPVGLLIYTENGDMSAQLGRSNRASMDECQALLESYLAYAGTFEVDEQNKCVSHFLEMALAPSWKDETQHRLVEFKQGFLQLSTKNQVEFEGVPGVGVLLWERVGN